MIDYQNCSNEEPHGMKLDRKLYLCGGADEDGVGLADMGLEEDMGWEDGASDEDGTGADEDPGKGEEEAEDARMEDDGSGEFEDEGERDEGSGDGEGESEVAEIGLFEAGADADTEEGGELVTGTEEGVDGSAETEDDIGWESRKARENGSEQDQEWGEKSGMGRV